MNDYVVPNEVVEWVKEEICTHEDIDGEWVDGYLCAFKSFLNKINVVYTKDSE